MSYHLVKKNQIAINVTKVALILKMIETMEAGVVKKKRMWVRSFIAKFGDNGHYENVYNEWRYQDPHMFRVMLRITPESFATLLRLVEDKITKQTTHIRKPISADKRLSITLRFLATGESFVSLGGQFCVGNNTVGEIVFETCAAIASELSFVMKQPDTPEEWLDISDKFYSKWDYPNCIGALDGSHILIEPPPESGSYFYNYKGQNSIVLMALVGPDKEFLYANVGVNGRVSDGGVWARCDFKKKLDKGLLNLPSAVRLPGSSDPTPIPFHVVGDEAFPLGVRLMKPYNKTQVSNNIPNRIFNYRLSRARIVSENAFGILTNRFEVFRAPMRIAPDKAVIVTFAALTLHNWLIKMNENKNTRKFTQILGTGMVNLVDQDDYDDFAAMRYRAKINLYANGDGTRYWQWDKI